MKIHSHNISITDSEMEIIGEALCESIIKEVKLFSQVADLNSVKNQLEYELDLLHQLTNIGYKLWVGEEEPLDGSFECDVNVWFDKIYTAAVAEHEASKVK